MKTLFISYDGLADPLGQSQIIPYMSALSKKGHIITILSCEKKINYSQNYNKISDMLKKANIRWHYEFYHNSIPVLSSFWNFYRLKKKAGTLQKKSRFDIIHCRSYIPALIGQQLKRKYNAGFIFEMIGFWADERIEGKIWNHSNIIFKQLYRYFKKKEIEFISEADYIITGSEKSIDIIRKWNIPEKQKTKLKAIYSCADTGLFSYDNIDKKRQSEIKAHLNIQANDFIITYSGSTGTWYMLDEMLLFFKQLLIDKTHAKFLIITPEQKEMITKTALRFSIPSDRLIVYHASREDMPLMLNLSNIAVFFIRPFFSKKASSPTKLAEFMSMGIPVICNSGIGDVDRIIEKSKCGFLIHGFNEEEYCKAISKIDSLISINKNEIRDEAEKFLSLNVAINQYDEVYTKVTKNS